MYIHKMRTDAIRRFDTIIETPKIQNIPTQIELSSTTDQTFGDSEAYSEEKAQAIVEEASKALEVINTELTFRVHEGTGRSVIQLVELGTKEVIREIPPEKMLDIVAGIWEWAGRFVDRKE